MKEKCALCEQPVLEKILAGKIVAIDVGHGWSQAAAYDVGAKGNGTTEQELNAKVAFKVQAILQTLGAVVHVFDYAAAGSPRLWLSEKGKRAGAVKANVFVSIHHNAINGSAQGTEVLVHSQATEDDVALAKKIHKHLIDNLKLADRGVKWQQLGVLKGCPESIPACLTEAFFIDSVKFKGKIPDDVIEAEALAIAMGIKDYLVKP
jgi:N-acetylmuramoyl-L-alanine amidase